MDAMTISEAAEATGFSASALRFYETAGLITPRRSEAGYRTYGDDDLLTLRFIGRAKRLGLSLEDIAEVVPLLDAGACGAVQDQLRSYVLDKVAETQRRTTDLIAFLGQLQAVAARLGRHTPDGGCDDLCGCTTDTADTAGDDHWVGATLVPSDGSDVPIACTLAPDRMDERVAAWRAVTATARHRDVLDDGARIDLPRTTDLAALARLIADEQTCCAFFTFTLTVDRDAVHLDVTAPPDGVPLARTIVGLGAGATA